MKIIHFPKLMATTCALLFSCSAVQANEVSPALKKSADLLQSILQTAFKDNEQVRLSSFQYSYLSDQGLLFQANSHGKGGFVFHGMTLPVAPPAPAPDGSYEFEFDFSEDEMSAEAAQEFAEQVRDQARQTYRTAEKQRAIERELRNTEREKREFEFSNSLSKLDSEQQQALDMLQQKTKVLQQKLAEVSKEAEQNRQQLEQQRAKQQAEQQQQTALMIKTIGEKFSQVLCDYGASLRELPESEYVSLQVRLRGNAGKQYWVMKKADINQCMTGKIKPKDLLVKAKSYQF